MRSLDDAGEPRSGTWERVLVAAGRRPALLGLGLEHAGVAFDHHGEPQGFAAETLRIGQTPVFLAGDVSGLRPLLHEAIDEGHIAGENAARLPDGVEAKPRRCKLNVVFTEPQLVVVGDGCADDETYAHGEVDWGRQGRARVLGKNVGMTRVYATRADRVLRGAEMAGPGAEHMGHLVAWAVQQGLEKSAREHPNITLVPDMGAIDLILGRHQQRFSTSGRIHGAYALNRKSGKVETFAARATILATGGADPGDR